MDKRNRPKKDARGSENFRGFPKEQRKCGRFIIEIRSLVRSLEEPLCDFHHEAARLPPQDSGRLHCTVPARGGSQVPEAGSATGPEARKENKGEDAGICKSRTGAPEPSDKGPGTRSKPASGVGTKSSRNNLGHHGKRRCQ